MTKDGVFCELWLCEQSRHSIDGSSTSIGEAPQAISILGHVNPDHRPVVMRKQRAMLETARHSVCISVAVCIQDAVRFQARPLPCKGAKWRGRVPG